MPTKQEVAGSSPARITVWKAGFYGDIGLVLATASGDSHISQRSGLYSESEAKPSGLTVSKKTVSLS